MSLTTTNPQRVPIEHPVLTKRDVDAGWRVSISRHTLVLQNPRIRWIVGVFVAWGSRTLVATTRWIARSERTGTSASFETWQAAVNFAEITGELE